MPRERGEPLVQKVFMCPLGLLEKLKKEARKTGKSESEIIREALRKRLNT
jgi:predicted DNA-binding protein